MSEEEKKAAVKEAPAKEVADVPEAEKKAAQPKVKKAESQKAAPAQESLVLRLPRTLQKELEQRREAEGVSMDELVTYLLMRGMM